MKFVSKSGWHFRIQLRSFGEFSIRKPRLKRSGGALKFDTLYGVLGGISPNDTLYTSIVLNEGLGNITISEFRISWQTSRWFQWFSSSVLNTLSGRDSQQKESDLQERFGCTGAHRVWSYIRETREKSLLGYYFTPFHQISRPWTLKSEGLRSLASPFSIWRSAINCT